MFFLTGDEFYYEEMREGLFSETFGTTLPSKKYRGKEFFEQLKKKFNVFFIHKKYQY